MPTLPPIVPERTTAGIAVDPRTLERVVPQTKRSDGSVRKELKIRPGFTPQEDVVRFKTSRQQATEKNALPKGHIVGWVPPSSSQSSKSTNAASSGATANQIKVSTVDANGQPLSKAALKNAKRKAKKIAEKANGGANGDELEEEEEEAEKPVVGTAEDAPEAWDEEGDEDAPVSTPLVADADAAKSPTVKDTTAVERNPKPPSGQATPTPSKEKKKLEPGVEGLRRALGGLSVSK